jgi:hypothetical protein
MRVRILSPLCLMVVAASCGSAQSSDYFNALTVPPASVGTCFTGKSVNGVPGDVSLIMKAINPDRQREIIVRRDKSGRIVQYAEIGFRAVELLEGISDDVVGIFDPQGNVVGYRSRRSTRMQMPSGGMDSVSLRRMRETSVSHGSREALDRASANQVARLARWVLKRCSD